MVIFEMKANGAEAQNSVNDYQELGFTHVINYVRSRIANEAWLKYHGGDFAPADVIKPLQDLPIEQLEARVYGKSDIKLFDDDGEGYYFNAFTGLKTEDVRLLKCGGKYYNVQGKKDAAPANIKFFGNEIDLEEMSRDAQEMTFEGYREKYYFEL